MEVKSVMDRLRDYIEMENYAGYDPYDALNSPIIRLLTFNNKMMRIAATQAMKRMPVNIRPLLAIRKEHNPKGIGLFLWGYSRLYGLQKDQRCLEIIHSLLDILEKLRSPGCTGNAWGYNFDWQSRAFFLPRFTPTLVNSSFIGHALLDAYRETGMEKPLAMARPIADFILHSLNRLEEGDGFCFSYTPLDRYFVHNANLMGASLLIRLSRFSGSEEAKRAALAALDYSLAHQREDGSWFYAERDGAHWIDSFHTGFNLTAIRYFLEDGEGGEYRAKFEKGVEFYARNFFLDDGTPKYFHDRTYPVDIHSAAQAIAFFSGMGGEYRGLTGRILNWTIAHMLDKKGYFYFQKHRFHTNRIPYMRWSSAWMFHALSCYIAAHKEILPC